MFLGVPGNWRITKKYAVPSGEAHDNYYILSNNNDTNPSCMFKRGDLSLRIKTLLVTFQDNDKIHLYKLHLDLVVFYGPLNPTYTYTHALKQRIVSKEMTSQKHEHVLPRYLFKKHFLPRKYLFKKFFW